MPQQGKRVLDDRLMLALACGATVEAAARQAGVSEKTAYRRLAESDFKKRLRGVRNDIVQRTAGALTAAATESVRTLLELQKSPSPPAVRLGAARAVLEVGMKVREMTDLQEEVAELEARLGEIEGDKGVGGDDQGARRAAGTYALRTSTVDWLPDEAPSHLT